VNRWQGAPPPQTLTWPGANKMGHATVWATCLRLKAFCGDDAKRTEEEEEKEVGPRGPVKQRRPGIVQIVGDMLETAPVWSGALDIEQYREAYQRS